MKKLKLTPIDEIGGVKSGVLYATYAEILAAVFVENSTHLDDPEKVKASWGFQDENGRKAFIFCYKQPSKSLCTEWSVCGNNQLLVELFGDKVSLEPPFWQKKAKARIENVTEALSLTFNEAERTMIVDAVMERFYYSRTKIEDSLADIEADRMKAALCDVLKI